ncbi:hypothetical protein SAMN05444008_112117 [Cnuella takakiae]|uniref:Uncharacterized protein n=1 Tax=Cnuella takakiae TaxID=1302690 RepID=A0A1M5ENP6_9BACT|nr:hypothetical protein [Cnuella takakiae]OLY91242.1 hypothetical protein BUE76_04490 [Cnuella takakiae]SHF80774.1 hypothetical protein SAMN05444008_112117 [Cnuella takakiae]
MEPNTKPITGSVPEAPGSEEQRLKDYFGHHTVDEKEALKLHSADTPEGLSRALNEQMGGGNTPVRPHPNEL